MTHKAKTFEFLKNNKTNTIKNKQQTTKSTSTEKKWGI